MPENPNVTADRIFRFGAGVSASEARQALQQNSLADVQKRQTEIFREQFAAITKPRAKVESTLTTQPIATPATEGNGSTTTGIPSTASDSPGTITLNLLTADGGTTRVEFPGTVLTLPGGVPNFLISTDRWQICLPGSTVYSGSVLIADESSP